MGLTRQDMVLPEMAMVTVEPSMRFVGRSFEERCQAARAGGFAGLGLSLASYREALISYDDEDLMAMLRQHDLVLSEIESIGMPGPGAQDSFRTSVAAILAMADVFAADHFFVVATDNVSGDDHVETFRWLCDECAPHGLRVGIEAMDIPGVSGIRDVATALAVARRAGRANGGLMIDTYHYFNGPSTWSDLEEIPGEMVIGIQISDGGVPRVAADYIEDTLHFRAPPGEGAFDLVQFVRVMDRIGADVPYSVEVIDDDLQRLTPEEAGRRLGNATRAVLTTARA
jgi:sugar phosphate isomerase/epimerase